jgi:hypothetical protein
MTNLLELVMIQLLLDGVQRLAGGYFRVPSRLPGGIHSFQFKGDFIIL